MTDFDTGLRIKEKARDLFMQYGLRSVSMDDIAGNLGMSKKTIYQYYADKDELIVEVINKAFYCSVFAGRNIAGEEHIPYSINDTELSSGAADINSYW